MPLASDKDATADFILSVDMDRPLETRPAFLVRFMRREERERVDRLTDQAYQLPATREGNADCFRLLCEAVSVGVVGWRNIIDPETREPLAFDAQRLEDLLGVVLTERELWELARHYPVVVKPAGPV